MLSTMRSVTAVTLALSALSLQTVSAITAGPVTDAGCFSASAGLEENNTFNYQSKGHCQETCIGVGATVMAMTDGNDCWCGSTLPAKSSLQSDDSKCSTTCVGYPDDMCKLTLQHCTRASTNLELRWRRWLLERLFHNHRHRYWLLWRRRLI